VVVLVSTGDKSARKRYRLVKDDSSCYLDVWCCEFLAKGCGQVQRV